jgi:hypothetical protein
MSNRSTDLLQLGRVKGDRARIGISARADVRVDCAKILERRHEFAQEALQAGSYRLNNVCVLPMPANCELAAARRTERQQ